MAARKTTSVLALVAQWLHGRLWAPLAILVAGGAALPLLLPCDRDTAWLALGLWLCLSVWPHRRRVWRRLGVGVCLALVAGLRSQAIDTADGVLEALRDEDLPLPRTQAPLQRLRAVTEPEWTPWGWRFDADWLARCALDSEMPHCDRRWGRLRVTVADQTIVVRRGQVLRVPGFVTPPPGYRNLGAGDLSRRWRWQGRIGVLGLPDHTRIYMEPDQRPMWQVVAETPADVWAAIARLRYWLGAQMAVAVPGPVGGLTTALALGDRRTESPELEEWFRRTGTAHAMAVSGSHLALVVLATRFALRRLLLGPWRQLLRRRPLHVWLTPPCVAMAWGYAALTGGAPSALRAAWMVSGLLVGQSRGGQLDISESLGFSALVLLLWDPLTVADAGWLLSVSGVLGLVWAGSLPTAPGWRGHLQTAWRTSLGPGALTAGIALVTFGQMPLTGVVANLPVAPYASLLLPVALSATLLAGLLRPTAPIPWLQWVCQAGFAPLQWLSTTPQSLWPVWQVEGWPGAVIGVAVSCTLAAVWHRGAWLQRSAAAWLVVAAALGTDRWAHRVASDCVEVRLLDVGHGQAALVRTGAGHAVLVDAGGEVGDDGKVGERAVVPVLRRLGLQRLDAVALSHAHPDHENGLLGVARHMQIDEFWWNGQVPGGDEHGKLLALLAAQGSRWRNFAQAPRQLVLGPLQLSALWPRPPQVPFDPGLGMNDNSLVLELAVGEQRLLLPGDVEHAAEAALVQEGRLRPTPVLASPHHGSRTSSTPAFLGVLQPGLAIAGARSWGTLVFPHPEVSRRHAHMGIHLWSTQDGEVVVTLGPEGIKAIQGQRSWAWQSDKR